MQRIFMEFRIRKLRSGSGVKRAYAETCFGQPLTQATRNTLTPARGRTRGLPPLPSWRAMGTPSRRRWQGQRPTKHCGVSGKRLSRLGMPQAAGRSPKSAGFLPGCPAKSTFSVFPCEFCQPNLPKIPLICSVRLCKAFLELRNIISHLMGKSSSEPYLTGTIETPRNI